jgi:hypothetical protein
MVRQHSGVELGVAARPLPPVRHPRCHGQYPVVELVTGALFVLVVWLTPVGPLMASRLLLVCILIALFSIDLEHQILPNSITLAGHRDRRVAQPDRSAGVERRADRRRAWRRHPLCDRVGLLPLAA